MLCECVELYIYLSFVYFSICWVLFHTMPPFTFVFCWAYGLAEGRLILSQPSADCSLPGGSLWGGASRKASPERGGARRKRAEGFVPQRWLVAAALSAAVTSSQKQKNAPNAHGRASLKESSSLFPPTLRVGARGRRFSQRSGLPRSTPIRHSLINSYSLLPQPRRAAASMVRMPWRDSMRSTRWSRPGSFEA